MQITVILYPLLPPPTLTYTSPSQHICVSYSHLFYDQGWIGAIR